MISFPSDLPATTSVLTSTGALPASLPPSSLSGAGADFAGLLGALLPEGDDQDQGGQSPGGDRLGGDQSGDQFGDQAGDQVRESAIAFTPTALPLSPPLSSPTPPTPPPFSAALALPGDTPLPAPVLQADTLVSTLRVPRGTILPEPGTGLPGGQVLTKGEDAPVGPAPTPTPTPATATATATAPIAPAVPVAPVAVLSSAPATPLPAATIPVEPDAGALPVLSAITTAEAANPVAVETASAPLAYQDSLTLPAGATPIPLAAMPASVTAVAPDPAAVATIPRLGPVPAAEPAVSATPVVPALIAAPTASPAALTLSLRPLRQTAAAGIEREDAPLPARVTLPPTASDGPSTPAPVAAALSVDVADRSAAAPITAPPAPTLIAAAPPTAPSPLPEQAAPRALAPQQETTIAQVGELREALRAARPELTLRHAEFGFVALQVEPTGTDGWRAVLASRDPGFVPAIQTALAERTIAATADSASTSMGTGTSTGTGTGQHPASDPRYGSSPGSGQGSPQPYMGQSGSSDGEAAPDHRHPRAAAARAARAEDGEAPGSPAPHTRGVFA